MVGMTVTPHETFADRLRHGTAAAHRAAEQSPLFTGFVDGSAGTAGWMLLLEQYRAIYGALEEVVGRMPENVPAQALFSVELNRVAAIDADLTALRVRTGIAPVGLLASTRDYAEHILACSSSVPRFVAHHYTRYLGDLSGGQVMHAWLRRSGALLEGETAFFAFDGIAGPPFKRRYREALNALDLDELQEQALLDEARLAFDANRAVFDEVHEVLIATETARAA